MKKYSDSTFVGSDTKNNGVQVRVSNPGRSVFLQLGHGTRSRYAILTPQLAYRVAAALMTASHRSELENVRSSAATRGWRTGYRVGKRDR